AEFDDLQPLGTLSPVVNPANDNIATFGRVAVIAKVATLEFKLNSDALPLARADLSFSFAVREPRLHRLNKIPKLSRHNPKEKNDAVLVDWSVPQSAEIDGSTVSGTVAKARRASAHKPRWERLVRRDCAAYCIRRPHRWVGRRK